VSKPAKKERRRLKQKQKHKQAIKLRNESPYKRLGKSGRIESCKVNDTCREQGLFSIYAMISVPNRPPTLVCFLVDKWCMGLKDAWGRLDMTHEEYHDFIESANHRAGFTLVDVRAAYALGRGLELFSRVENLFDERYETVFQYGTAGRAAYGGVRWSL